MSKLTVIAINITKWEAMLSNNTVVPVTNWFDGDGDECEPYEATDIVCGSDAAGWFAVKLAEFQKVRLH